jgi:hypothetical protein
LPLFRLAPFPSKSSWSLVLIPPMSHPYSTVACFYAHNLLECTHLNHMHMALTTHCLILA